MIALFDEIWEPDSGNSSMRLDLLRALTKAGNYAVGRLRRWRAVSCSGRASGSSGRPSHAELHSHIAGVRPAGLGRSVGFALKVHQRAWCLRRGRAGDRVDLRPADQAERVLQPGQAGGAADGVPAELLRRDGRRHQRRDRDRPDARALGPAVGRRGGRVRGAAAARVVRGRAGPRRRRGAVRPAPTAARCRGRRSPAGRASRDASSSACPPTSRRCACPIPRSAAAWRTALRDVLSPLLSGGARVTGFDRSGWYVVSTGKEMIDEADRG